MLNASDDRLLSNYVFIHEEKCKKYRVHRRRIVRVREQCHYLLISYWCKSCKLLVIFKRQPRHRLSAYKVCAPSMIFCEEQVKRSMEKKRRSMSIDLTHSSQTMSIGAVIGWWTDGAVTLPIIHCNYPHLVHMLSMNKLRTISLRRLLVAATHCQQNQI